MTLALTAYIDRVQAALMDDGTIFTDAAVTEALRSALGEYSDACPNSRETVLTLAAAGREIALSSLAGLRAVTRVWWPYDAVDETWPPNRARRYTLGWDDGAPNLFLEADDGAQPQAGDQVRLWYTLPHTIQLLDGAAATSVPDADESLLVLGASAYALLARSYDQTESASAGAIATPNYAASGFRLLRQFRQTLDGRRHDAALGPEPAWTGGWRLDKWDA